MTVARLYQVNQRSLGSPNTTAYFTEAGHEVYMADTGHNAQCPTHTVLGLAYI